MREVIHILVIDLQQPVSVPEATALRCSSWRHVSDYVTQAAPLDAQAEAVRVPFLTFEDAQPGAGRRHGV